jgi:hypothetical protein
MLTKTVEIDWLILVAPAANVKQDLNYPSINISYACNSYVVLISPWQ